MQQLQPYPPWSHTKVKSAHEWRLVGTRQGTKCKQTVKSSTSYQSQNHIIMHKPKQWWTYADMKQGTWLKPGMNHDHTTTKLRSGSHLYLSQWTLSHTAHMMLNTSQKYNANLMHELNHKMHTRIIPCCASLQCIDFNRIQNSIHKEKFLHHNATAKHP